MTVYNYLIEKIQTNGSAYLVLIDPDKLDKDKLEIFVRIATVAGVDGFLIGGSLMIGGNFESYISRIKAVSQVPVIIFPGGVNQLSPKADALLYLSIVSGRNPEHLIGKHVIAAPIIRRYELEPISTGYLLIESGSRTTAEYMSGSMSIPRAKPEIAAATALAAEYMGMKLIYLEAGSGADMHVPFNMVRAVSFYCSIPLIVGGGIKSAETAYQMVENGAKIVVTGNFFEDESKWDCLIDFSNAIHRKVKNI